MITITDILDPNHVDLQLGSVSQQDAIFRLANMLRHDSRVLDWPKFFAEIQSRNPCVADGKEFEICIPHARTNAVGSMVMSVGRSESGIQVNAKKVNYIFVIGVPNALAADYLRIIGALARIFRDPSAEHELRTVTEPADFVKLLAQREMRL